MADSRVDEFLACAGVLILPDNAVFPVLNAVVEQTGYDAGLLSAGPLERLLKYFREEVRPRIQSEKDRFMKAVAESKDAIQKHFAEFAHYTLESAAQVHQTAREYLDGMLQEGLAGPKTATLVITMATADALQKILSQSPDLALESLTYSDWIMMALFWLRFAGSGTNPDRPQ